LIRLEAVHKLVREAYPKAIGVDAAWHHSLGYALFANEVKFESSPTGAIHADPVKGMAVAYFYYTSYICPYYCGKKPNEIMPGYPCESSAGISVAANNLSGFLGGWDDSMTVENRPIKFVPALKKMWKDYELFYPEVGSSERIVLLHRKDVLPYVVVTRKEYLDHSIKHLTEIYGNIIKGFLEMPVRSPEEQEAEKKKILDKYQKDYGNDPKKLKSATDYYLSTYQTDQQRRDELIKKQSKIKNDLLKRYRDELEKTTKENLLDLPAIVLSMHTPDMTTSIFVTEAEQGKMLVTENPNYIRKDLPKYVPQILVLKWSASPGAAHDNFIKMINENFPVEKLQAMIDK
jgi:hypothetical protein